MKNFMKSSSMQGLQVKNLTVTVAYHLCFLLNSFLFVQRGNDENVMQSDYDSDKDEVIL